MSMENTSRPPAISQAEWERNFDRAFAPTRATPHAPTPHQCPDCGGEAFSVAGTRDVCLDCGRGAPV
jgi:hypothetical protein